MSDVGTDLGLVVLESLDFDPQCESLHHDSKPYLHDDGPAVCFVATACGHGDGLRCARFQAVMIGSRITNCSFCGAYGPASERLTYFPIPEGAAT